jgi:hypothetical protein
MIKLRGREQEQLAEYFSSSSEYPTISTLSKCHLVLFMEHNVPKQEHPILEIDILLLNNSFEIVRPRHIIVVIL